jgi:hypothetical protein
LAGEGSAAAQDHVSAEVRIIEGDRILQGFDEPDVNTAISVLWSALELGADDGIRTRDPHLGNRNWATVFTWAFQKEAAQSAFSIYRCEPQLTILVNGVCAFGGTQTTTSCTTCTTAG